MGANEEQPAESYIIKEFKKYSQELTAKQDKHERIIKLSRDIAIESKRIIFRIHSLVRKCEDLEVEGKNIRVLLQKLVATNFKKIALELENEDPYLYRKAYAFGVQEYIEALSFLNYVTSSKLTPWDAIVDDCTYTFEGIKNEDRQLETTNDQKKVQLLITLSDYIFGIQDMTGEMMRLCINALGARHFDTAQSACNFVKYVYAALHLAKPKNRKEFKMKFEVVGQSLGKMEYGCYTAKIREIEMDKINFK